MNKQIPILRILKQTGKRKSVFRDMARSARLPGKRRSLMTGNIYWEARKNRSDKLGTRL